MPDVPQLRFPVDLSFSLVAQGSVDDGISQAHVTVLTPQGWMTSNPDFGLYPQDHLSGGADIGEIDRQFTEYVPDALAAATEQPDALNPLLSIVGVRLRGR